jgi:heme A synthase
MLNFVEQFRSYFSKKNSTYEVFDISEVKPARSVEQTFRKVLYLFLMFSRVFLFLGIVIFYNSLPIFVVVAMALAAVFLPFFAMVFANSPKN